MGRQPLPLGTWGKFSTYQLDSGAWRATARFRGINGNTRTVSRQGSTVSVAERKLTAALIRLSSDAGGDITATVRVADATRAWLEEATLNVSGSTLDSYRRLALGRIVPAIGNLRLGEVTVGVVDRFLRAEAAVTPSQVRNTKSVLSQILALAVRHGAIRTNPVRDAGRMRIASTTPRALTAAEIQQIRTLVKAYVAGLGRSGPRRSAVILDIADLFLATGARTGELLALRWEDVQIDTSPFTIEISGTLVEQEGVPVFRKPSPKTAAGHRTLILPAHAAQVLRRRRDGSRTAWVFETSNNTVLAPQDVQRTFRRVVAGSALHWVTPRSLRETVATIIEDRLGADSAAKQLGHSDPAITRRHHIQKPAVTPDVSDLLGESFEDD